MDAPIYDTMLRGLKHILAVLLKHSQGSCSKKLKDTHDIHKMAKTLKEFSWTALQNDALDTVMLYRNGWAHGSHTRLSWFKLGEALPILGQWLSVVHCKHQCDIPCAVLLCESLKNTCSLLFSSRRIYVVEKDPVDSLQESVVFVQAEQKRPTEDTDLEKIDSSPQYDKMEELFPTTAAPTAKEHKWNTDKKAISKSEWHGTIAELIAGDFLPPDGRLRIMSGDYNRCTGYLITWNGSVASISIVGKMVTLPLTTQVSSV